MHECVNLKQAEKEEEKNIDFPFLVSALHGMHKMPSYGLQIEMKMKIVLERKKKKA